MVSIERVFIKKISTIGHNRRLFNVKYYMEQKQGQKLIIKPICGYESVVYNLVKKSFVLKLPINRKRYSKIENELNYNHNYIYLLNGYNNPIQQKVSRRIGKVLFYLFWYLPIIFLKWKEIFLIKRCIGKKIINIQPKIMNEINDKFSFYLEYI